MSRWLSPVLLLLPLLPGLPARADPGPAAVVAALHEALIATMREGKALGFAGRFERLAPTVTETFDLAQMTRLAAGSSWAKFSKEEQEALAAGFRRYSIANYAVRFVSFAGERFEQVGERTQDGLGTLVETRLVPGDGQPVTLTYLLRERGGDWRAIDVYLTGTISELAVKRSEFAAVLAREGIAGLLKLLEQRNEEMAKRD